MCLPTRMGTGLMLGRLLGNNGVGSGAMRRPLFQLHRRRDVVRRHFEEIKEMAIRGSRRFWIDDWWPRGTGPDSFL